MNLVLPPSEEAHQQTRVRFSGEEPHWQRFGGLDWRGEAKGAGLVEPGEEMALRGSAATSSASGEVTEKTV